MNIPTDVTSLVLALASTDDAYALWLWSNDRDTMHASGRLLPFSWSEHDQWLSGAVRSGRCLIFVATTEHGQPVGTVRFDVVGRDRMRLSYTVAPERRGQGWGTRLVAEGVAELRSEAPKVVIDADVRSENERSLRVFRGLGWQEQRVGEMVRFTNEPEEVTR